MEVFFILVVLTMHLLQSISSKSASLGLTSIKKSALFVTYRALISAIIAALFIMIFQQSFIPTQNALIFGILGAVGISINFLFTLLAMKKGAVSFVQILSQASNIIILIYSWTILNEPFKWLQLLGFILIIGSSILIIIYNRNTKGETSVSTVVFAIIAMLSNGLVGISQKALSAFDSSDSFASFNLLMFGFSFIILFFITISFKDKSNEKISLKVEKKLIFPLIILGVSVFFISQFMTMLSITVPAAILFPLISGLVTIIVAIASAIIFKERITRLSVLAILFTILGLFMLQI